MNEEKQLKITEDLMAYMGWYQSTRTISPSLSFQTLSDRQGFVKKIISDGARVNLFATQNGRPLYMPEVYEILCEVAARYTGIYDEVTDSMDSLLYCSSSGTVHKVLTMCHKFLKEKGEIQEE